MTQCKTTACGRPVEQLTTDGTCLACIKAQAARLGKAGAA